MYDGRCTTLIHILLINAKIKCLITDTSLKIKIISSCDNGQDPVCLIGKLFSIPLRGQFENFQRLLHTCQQLSGRLEFFNIPLHCVVFILAVKKRDVK